MEGRPPAAQWSGVYDKSRREGRKVGNPRSGIRVVGVESKITSEELKEQLEGGGRLLQRITSSVKD